MDAAEVVIGVQAKNRRNTAPLSSPASSGQDAVELEIRGGRLLTTVDHETPDDQVLEHHGYLSGELILEDGRRLTFEIHDGAEGAQWTVGDGRPQDSFVGLSVLENPGGV